MLCIINVLNLRFMSVLFVFLFLSQGLEFEMLFKRKLYFYDVQYQIMKFYKPLF